jgi:hypothetical protein
MKSQVELKKEYQQMGDGKLVEEARKIISQIEKLNSTLVVQAEAGTSLNQAAR